MQMQQVDAVEVEAIVRQHLANACNEVCASFKCAPANVVALMVKECVDGLGEIDTGLTRRYLRHLRDAYGAKLDGDYKSNVKHMTYVALVLEELVLAELQKFAKPESIS